MAQHSQATSSMAPKANRRKRPFQMLLVTDKPELQQQVRRATQGQRAELTVASNIDQAKAKLSHRSFQLLIVEPKLSDGLGVDFASQLLQKRRTLQAMLINGLADSGAVLHAMRHGFSDYLPAPVTDQIIGDRLQQAMARQQGTRQLQQRVHRLRKLCHKLNNARQEVTHQVDILCNDLVTAYQELASQMQRVVQASEYVTLVRQELDLEQLLHTTLEFMLQKAGPTNAAVFLPASVDEYSLGGYVNYDCADSGADLLLQHMADTLAPRVAGTDQVVHATNAEQLIPWMGEQNDWVRDSHMLASACEHEGEVLAVLAVFRSNREPFDEAFIEVFTAVAPLLAEYLTRIIRIHHRHLPFEDQGQFDDEAELDITGHVGPTRDALGFEPPDVPDFGAGAQEQFDSGYDSSFEPDDDDASDEDFGDDRGRRAA